MKIKIYVGLNPRLRTSKKHRLSRLIVETRLAYNLNVNMLMVPINSNIFQKKKKKAIRIIVSISTSIEKFISGTCTYTSTILYLLKQKKSKTIRNKYGSICNKMYSFLGNQCNAITQCCRNMKTNKYPGFIQTLEPTST